MENIPLPRWRSEGDGLLEMAAGSLSNGVANMLRKKHDQN